MKYVEISNAAKLKLLKKHSLGTKWNSLDDKKWCLHCGKQFTGKSARVYEDSTGFWLECGTKGCDGSPIDWAEYPWWDRNHPITKAKDEIDALNSSGDPENN